MMAPTKYTSRKHPENTVARKKAEYTTHVASKWNNAFFRQLLFVLLLITVGVIIFQQLDFFLGAFLGATTIYIVLRRIMFRLSEELRIRRGIVALILVVFTTIILSGLGFLVSEVIAKEIPDVDASKMLEGLKGLSAKVNGWIGYNILPDNLTKISGDTGGIFKTLFSSILNTTYSFAANIFMMLIILYFMLAQGRKMEARVFEYLPFRGRSLNLLKSEFWNMVYSNAIGIPLTMTAQGLTASLTYWILGLHNVVFWAFLTAVCGLIPMVGTSLVTLPLGIYMLADGETVKGVILILAGLLVIANADNVCRIVLMKNMANTHPLIIIFGVIMGIPLFGLWGIIFGPLLLSGFILLIRIYYVEYGLLSPDKVNRRGQPDTDARK